MKTEINKMYIYKNERERIFTEEGQVMFLKIRDKIYKFLKMAGAFKMDEAIGNCSGDSWMMLACVDRLVELGEIEEITRDGRQNRVFVAGNNFNIF